MNHITRQHLRREPESSRPLTPGEIRNSIELQLSLDRHSRDPSIPSDAAALHDYMSRHGCDLATARRKLSK